MKTTVENPQMTIFRTNGVRWAAYQVDEDGLEHPVDVYNRRSSMLRARNTCGGPSKVEWRPQALGCDTPSELSGLKGKQAAYDMNAAPSLIYLPNE